MTDTQSKLTRIGVFYDGNFFFHASNYYTYFHRRRARISIAGLHEFIRADVAARENVDVRYCQIVDAHYFRGRLPASEAEERHLLLKERSFDDVLTRAGVVTHYLPLSQNVEKGIDVWLALEVFELAMYKRFSVAVLVTGDGDYVPLVRKLNTLGTRVMVLGWDFKYMDANNYERETRTSQALLNEVTYPVLMSDVIEDRSRKTDPLLKNLFLAPKESRIPPTYETSGRETEAGTQKQRGVIVNLNEGYGFIAPDGETANLFFFHVDVLNRDFNDLHKGDAVEYVLGQNKKGPCARRISVLER